MRTRCRGGCSASLPLCGLDVAAVALPLSRSIQRTTDFGMNGWLPLQSPSSIRRFHVRAVVSSSKWSPPATARRYAGSKGVRTPPTEIEHHDSISFLNERIRREHINRRSPASRKSPTMDSEEAEKYIRLVKEQQRGLQKLHTKAKGEANPNSDSNSGAVSYKVDPYTLRSGDYVVHKKVGVGRS